MPVSVYLVLIIFEFAYMIVTPAETIFTSGEFITGTVLQYLGAETVYLFSIIITGLMVLVIVTIISRGSLIKAQQTHG